MAAATPIIQDIVAALRQAGLFAEVALAPSPSRAVPRAVVSFVAVEPEACDDAAGATAWRLRAKVVLHTRAQDAAEAVDRILSLYDGAAAALLADPYRGGRCQDLPGGKATEIGPLRTIESPLPDVLASFEVTCQFQTQGE